MCPASEYFLVNTSSLTLDDDDAQRLGQREAGAITHYVCRRVEPPATNCECLLRAEKREEDMVHPAMFTVMFDRTCSIQNLPNLVLVLQVSRTKVLYSNNNVSLLHQANDLRGQLC